MDATAVNKLHTEIINEIDCAKTTKDLEDIRVRALGKSGRITLALKGLADVSPSQRKDMGFKLNQVKVAAIKALDEKNSVLQPLEMQRSLEENAFDITLPARPVIQGRIHPVFHVMDEVAAIFAAMGFTVAQGPDIEDDFHNFTALNIPPNHPARQMQDTFYLNGCDENGNPYLLRTHTSPVQIRTMLEQKPPIRIIVPGRTYRVDSDATHSPMFHQVEGLVIDETCNMAHLKGCLLDFLQAFFETEDDIQLRFRPSFFPFTEPSAEVDVKIRDWDWLEIAGSGMVHPNVLRNCGIDPDKYQGFALGMGLDRLAMLKYGIPDLRPFFTSDARWLKHYGFAPLDIPGLIGGLCGNGGAKI